MYKIQLLLVAMVMLLITIFSYKHIYVNTDFLLALSSYRNILIGLGTFALCYVMYLLFVRPLDRVRRIGDVGYCSDKRLSKREVVNYSRQKRNVGRVPPVYPNGWFYLLESRDLKVKDSKMVNCLGK